MPAISNTNNIKSTDRQTMGAQPDGTPSTGGGAGSGGGGGGGGAVTQIVAGTNVTISPLGGTGAVTVNSAAAAVTQIVAGTNITVSPVGGTGAVTVNSTAAAGLLVATYSTWASMKAATAAAATWANGNVIMLENYNYAGGNDGGGGAFWWSSTSTVADDGGCIMQITSVTTGRLYRIAAGIFDSVQRNSTSVDLRWYGAIGGSNGGTATAPNMTGNSASMYNALQSMLLGITVFNSTLKLPGGYFNFNQPILLYSPAGNGQAISLKGEGGGTQLFMDLTTPGAWSNLTTYVPSNLVLQGGLNWVCTRNNASVITQTPNVSFTGSGITSGPTTFTVTATAHPFVTSSFVTISGAANGGYNGVWQVFSTTTNTFSVASTAMLGSDTVNLSTAYWSLQTYFLKVQGCNFNTVTDLNIVGPSPFNPTSVLWIDSCTYPKVTNVHIQGCTSTGAIGGVSGGQMFATINTDLQMTNVVTFQGGGYGWWWDSGSGQVTNCSWSTTSNNPASYLRSANSLFTSNITMNGGGPWASFASCGITSTGVHFTVTQAGHPFVDGDYIVIQNAAHAGYNGIWKIASHTSSTVVVTSGANLGSDTVTLSSLYASWYMGTFTESGFTDTFLNTNGFATPIDGACAVFVDGYVRGGAGEAVFNGIFGDYGGTTVFLHGTANSDPGSSVGSVSLVNVRPNGAPRGTFGGIRLEGVVCITVEAPRFFPGTNAPGTGLTFSTLVISDGGQTQNTQDIIVTGGSLTNKHSSGLYPSATIQAVVIDGSFVHNVSIANVGVDASKTVMSLINSAALSNGITMIYGNNAGRMFLIDSVRGNPGTAL